MKSHLTLSYQHLVKVVFPAFLATKEMLLKSMLFNAAYLPALVNTEITLIHSIELAEYKLRKIGIDPRSII